MYDDDDADDAAEAVASTRKKGGKFPASTSYSAKPSVKRKKRKTENQVYIMGAMSRGEL